MVCGSAALFWQGKGLPSVWYARWLLTVQFDNSEAAMVVGNNLAECGRDLPIMW